MKKLLLTSLISVAVLAGCSDEPEKKAVAKKEKTAEVAKKAAPKKEAPKKSTLPQNDQAEKSFKAMVEASQAYYNKILSASPVVKSIKYNTTSYEKGQEKSTAVTNVLVNLNTAIGGKKSFEISIKYDIQHDATVKGEGAIAKIQSSAITPKGLDAKQSKVVEEIIKHIDVVTTIRDDESYTQIVDIKSYNNEENQVDFKGMTFTNSSTITDTKDGFGTFNLDFKGFSAKDESVEIAPTGFEGEYKSNGEMTINSKQAFDMSAKGGALTVKSFAAKGNIKFNEKYGMMFGKATYTTKGIEVISGKAPTPIKFDSIVVGSDSSLENDIMSQHVTATIVPEAGLTSKLSGGMLDVSEAKFKFGIDNLPAKIITEYNKFSEKMFKDLEASPEVAVIETSKNLDVKMAEMFELVKKQGASIDLGIDLATTQGDLHLDANVALLKDSKISIDELKAGKPNPAALLQLINLNANLKVPAALVDGLGGVPPQAMMFIKKNGDNYESVIKTKDSQLMINDAPFPL